MNQQGVISQKNNIHQHCYGNLKQLIITFVSIEFTRPFCLSSILFIGCMSNSQGVFVSCTCSIRDRNYKC